ncbi:M43 family zinc metalloprotease [Lacihabitans soyangensis]|uniref:T9SS C-terminal target domain-containing protein n=1 Tax=Lacihabitans soyangensis TaxID=869394 RepID=A0AAE3H5D3_9BACT|nr:M43 family zinc metalloprotease [Lacihabitans soyangensis]MCP9765063.1 T9SS C-terminal target domain-containing protein [Lacihabitans soyangensis]
MKKRILSLLILFSAVLNLHAQKKCAVGDIADEKLRRRHEALNLKLQDFYRKYDKKSAFADKLIRIPVVVHIIHNNSAGKIGGENNGNISDEQVFSQIKVLNEDYRKKISTPGFNNSPVGTDMNIEFYLADKDPDGKPSLGINRVYSPKSNFDVFDEKTLLSSLLYWDSNRYLNIWVTTLNDDFLGYAEFPTGEYDGLEIEEIDEKIDGVMIDHRAFGRRTGTSISGVYTYGRTLTHEIGHWLGLIHIWGDEYCGDDFCNDTPPTESGNLTIRCTPKYSNCRGTRTLNMIENYMDYTADSCMNIFTVDQKTRVRAVLEVSKRRKRLVTNSEFNLPQAEKLIVKVLENPSSTDYLQFQILLNDFANFNYEIFDTSGKLIVQSAFEDSPSRLIQISKADLGKGIYNLRVKSGDEIVYKRLISQ